ncbi:hypothetical protein KAJ83_18775 [Marivibrio halodurans]|uniref:Antifreeze glycopeptide polyprotein n=1 Tax=Marivibrio halodurans TaxID=2039722 RepID=A0A8J7SBP2_9PROT|nr:hypothetical protein [Marivibrio halodurans]MBP5859072.1 hypothetical protein [Marivibrio halodurans]
MSGTRLAALALGLIPVLAMAPGDAGAQSQSTGPVQLFPADPNNAAGPNGVLGSESTSGAAGTGSTSRDTTPSVIGSGAEAVEVAPLDAPSAESVGLIGPESGGLPADMWAGSSRTLAHDGLRALPDRLGSPAARALAVRFLTSAAPGPDAGADAQPPAGDFMAARIDALIALGALEPARALAETARDIAATPALDRAVADARLAAGAVPTACADARSLSQKSDDPYWQKLLIFCQAAAGDTGEAEFGLGLLAEMGANDPLFMTLADGLIAGRAPDLSETDPAAFGAMHAAMARVSGAMPPEAVAVEGTAPAVATLLTMKPQALDLAEAAAWRGVLDPNRLAELYAGADFEPSALDNPLSAAESMDGARARALLYQSLAIQSIAPAKAELLTTAFATAARDGVYPIAVDLFTDQLMQLPPSSALTFFAETATRALLSVGAVERAGRWYALIEARARAGDNGAAEMTAARDRLWPLGRLAGMIPPEEGAAARIAAFERSVADRAPERAETLLLRTYLPLLALVPEARAARDALARHAFRAGGMETTAPNPAAGTLARLAAADGRIAETVLYALIRVGARPVPELSPEVLAETVQALDRVGLSREARRLALEALVAAGL